jgi:hypothetical protein
MKRYGAGRHEFMPGHMTEEKEDAANRFVWSHAIYWFNCPTCKVLAGYYCETPQGRRKEMAPHAPRLKRVPPHIGLVP